VEWRSQKAVENAPWFEIDAAQGRFRGMELSGRRSTDLLNQGAHEAKSCLRVEGMATRQDVLEPCPWPWSQAARSRREHLPMVQGLDVAANRPGHRRQRGGT
jgi:hypothetical protein